MSRPRRSQHTRSCSLRYLGSRHYWYERDSQCFVPFLSSRPGREGSAPCTVAGGRAHIMCVHLGRKDIYCHECERLGMERRASQPASEERSMQFRLRDCFASRNLPVPVCLVIRRALNSAGCIRTSQKGHILGYEPACTYKHDTIYTAHSPTCPAKTVKHPEYDHAVFVLTGGALCPTVFGIYYMILPKVLPWGANVSFNRANICMWPSGRNH